MVSVTRASIYITMHRSVGICKRNRVLLNNTLDKQKKRLRHNLNISIQEGLSTDKRMYVMCQVYTYKVN